MVGANIDLNFTAENTQDTAIIFKIWQTTQKLKKKRPNFIIFWTDTEMEQLGRYISTPWTMNITRVSGKIWADVHPSDVSSETRQ